jgi:ATP-binding cassette, subfamily C (CFTR/MRP), member 1
MQSQSHPFLRISQVIELLFNLLSYVVTQCILTETLAGLSTIRAYRRVQHFISENESKLDENLKAYFASIAANRWYILIILKLLVVLLTLWNRLAVRLEFIGFCVVTLAALFAVVGRNSINPGYAGLAITYSLSLTGLLNFLVRSSADGNFAKIHWLKSNFSFSVENQLVSVERVIQYTKLPSEAPARIPGRYGSLNWIEIATMSN